MNEKITAIREVFDMKQNTLGVGGGISSNIAALFGGGTYDGYEVTTDKQTIYVLIDNMQSCCESWGYLSSDDDLEQFVGAELQDISVVDTGLNERMVEAGTWLDDGGIIFVNLTTDKGVLQLACYNAHNGYYGHEVHIISEQLTAVTGV